ncbi:M23 family metallopeptidase [Olleya sp. YS]|uniref:M23 family metallopeptidase n=1 Tax=Olleya sp. YS TaxID=3028318 RepID=UPI0024342B06|nr:M23 family metallopeptidase [Olleya sp. YS]WGD33922.1 M23 family metallopeptidase [Olleya sp. YS]
MPATNEDNIVSKKVLDTFKFTNGYDFPVGKPDAKQYYNAQGFQVNDHLGDDWNGKGGGNTDFGDPIYAIANGYISFAEDYRGGWGNVIRIIHYNPDSTQVESLYAHCKQVFVKKGDYVTKGTKIGTIGTADGAYLAHLHLEIRDEIGLPIGSGYSTETEGYLDPTDYINNNR